MTFKQKVQSMSASEIILAMVRGLENPKVKINMSIFGHVEGGICYGCAYTAMICEISKAKKNPVWVDNSRSRAEHLKTDGNFLGVFEYAIDFLRKGEVESYNTYARRIGIAIIEDTIGKLPYLTNGYTPQELDFYRLLAVSQP